MRCEQVRSLLNEYCEGSLNEAMRERVEAHLRVCAACQREVQFVQAIWRGLAAMPEVVPPPDLHARIMTYVRANTRAREAQGRVAFWRWAGAAAAAAGLFIMGFFAAQSDGVQAAFGFQEDARLHGLQRLRGRLPGVPHDGGRRAHPRAGGAHEP
jgi:anti-sigma factor RsiW